jgi:DNA-binding XRE family transcriptional regulator
MTKKEYWQYVKCSKANCSTCREGRGHGPYLYLRWIENGRTRATYVKKEKAPPLDHVRMREVRLARGWTMAHVARLLGVNEGGYCDWEQGLHQPRDYARRKIDKLFGLK